MTRVHPLAPVVGLDIDGTLGDYHTHFYNFVRECYFPHELDRYQVRKPEWEYAEGEFSEALGMSKENYRAAKLAYRLGGMKRCLPTFSADLSSDIMNVVQEIRASGVQVWICTQRPWLALTTVDNDTQYWLNRYVGKVDGLIYGEDKYADLVDIVGKQRILGVVEDLPECIDRARSLELRTAARISGHNYDWYENTGGADSNFTSAIEIRYQVQRWKEAYDGQSND